MASRVAIAVIVLAALLTGGYFIDQNRKAKESLISGYFESQPAIASSRIGVRVVQILIREGDRVREGQILVKLEDTSFAASVEAQKKVEEQAAQQYLETLKGPRREEIAKARHALEQAQANYEKVKRG